MKIEINDEEFYEYFMNKFVTSQKFKKLFKDEIEGAIRYYANEFIEIGYKRGLKGK